MPRLLTYFARAWILILLGLAACQPSVELVEVPVTVQPPPPAVETVVVTRLVREQVAVEVPVTRLVTETVVSQVVATPAAPGSAARPLLLLLPPDVAQGVVAGRSPALLEWLHQATGRQFALQQAGTLAEVVDGLCRQPDRTLAILPALAAAWVAGQCAAQPTLTGVRFDVPYHAGMFLVRAGSGFTTLADLQGRSWGVAGQGAVARTLMAQVLMAQAGVLPGNQTLFNGDNPAIVALLEGSVDFVTVAFNPPIMPAGKAPWRFGLDSPEIWRQTGAAPQRHPIGYIDVLGGPEAGGYRLRDARAALFDISPTVFAETRILELTAPVPNGTIVFGGGLPLATANELERAFLLFGSDEPCRQSLCSADFFNWQALSPADGAAYNSLQALLEQLQFDEARLLTIDSEY